MRSLKVFENVSLDGYYCDATGDMSWAHAAAAKGDAAWAEFTRGNMQGGSVLVFGRVTYQMMIAFWPTPASKAMGAAADAINGASKIVFSRTLTEATWTNTRLVADDAVAELTRLKAEPGDPLVVLGSGTLVGQLAQAGLVDHYQLVVVPVVLGAGRSLFTGVDHHLDLTLTSSRAFANGNVVLDYDRG